TALRQRLVRGLFHRAEAAVKLVAGPVEGVLRVHARHLGDFGGHKQRVAQLLPDAVGRIGGL
ncbi:Ferredoxin, partial [Dysosmobacter welbionis]